MPGGLARRLDPVGLELLEAGLVLVHLGVLALAPVALDQLRLALHRVRLGFGVLLGPQVAFHALAVVGRVVAAEHREAAIPELPDAGHRRVQEGTVVRGDEQRPGAPPKVLLQPLDGVDVEVVRGLVQQQQVRVRYHQASEGGAGLLAARERRRRTQPLVAGEAEAGERLVHTLVERVAAKDVEAMLEVRVPVAPGMAPVFEVLELHGHLLEVRGAVPDRGPQVRGGHERLVEVRLLAQQAEGQVSAARDRPTVGLVAPGHDPEQCRLAGTIGTHEPHPLADGDGGIDLVEDDEGPDLPDDTLQADQAHPLTSAPALAAARRAAAADFVRNARSRATAASSAVLPSDPSPASSTHRRPRRPDAARPGRGVIVASSLAAAGRSAAGSRWQNEQKCVARMPITIRRIGRPQRGHGCPVRW